MNITVFFMRYLQSFAEKEDAAGASNDILSQKERTYDRLRQEAAAKVLGGRTFSANKQIPWFIMDADYVTIV
ncbi:hypothetical protein QWJ34_04565 [Saccharibacillus sp. CPCC 101409]|uniref:hypothetical protein n=1 Tax=Saccharibacillus sp. CPCC 101409 TaxID=3058041 RepID=UPI002672130D|nr:hypothetical protein [Saccharibacillus sp. CPCC 101409]MDO3409027.1 hypothetical protein [Saccharibacillus sp. CPCC 101409]